MIITKVERFATCKDRDNTCRYFLGMPPLNPGDVPDPNNKHFRNGGKHEERFIPDELGNGAHIVYRVRGGHGVLVNETAVFAKPDDIPMCWLVSANRLLHGREDIQAVFPDVFLSDDEMDPSRPLASVCAGLQRLGNEYGTKYALLVDTGKGWTMHETNDPGIMGRVRSALDAG